MIFTLAIALFALAWNAYATAGTSRYSHADPLDRSLSATCSGIVPGLYSSETSDARIDIRVENESFLTFFVEESSPKDSMSKPVTARYFIGTDCGIKVESVDSNDFHALIKNQSFLYIPSESRIRMSTVLFDLKAPLAMIKPGHYVKHISGVTAVIRIVNETHMVPMISLPSAVKKEHLSSSIIRYQIKPDGSLSYADDADKSSNFQFFKSVCRRIGGIDDDKLFKIDYCSASRQLTVGSLKLDLH